ncbi:kinase-like domain-containing protein [Syncephalis fuscata]|nr:kinase-like domain-containing protein [Syncephalis fuscata]
MTCSKDEQAFSPLPNAIISTSRSATSAATAAFTELAPSLLRDEDLAYSNVPDCWNDLSTEQHESTKAWVEIYDPDYEGIRLVGTKKFLVGSIYSGNYLATIYIYQRTKIVDYQFNSKLMSKYCFQFLVQYNTINCKNTKLSVLIVNGVELRAGESTRVAGDCLIEIPGSDTVFIVYLIKYTAPALIENSSLFRQRVGSRYMITAEIIGRGAFGTVRLGRDRRTRERVAVKISSAVGSIRSFKNEVAAMKRVGNHPRVIKMLGNEITPTNTYLILQYVAGGNLEHYIQHHKLLPEMEIKNIFKQLLEGIEFLHSKNIIHRDIKPSNILMLEGREDVKVVYTDFGLAHILRSSSAVYTCGGTVSYMAPEVLFGTDKRESLLSIISKDPLLKSRLTPALLGADGCGKPADMWSLGATLYEMFFDNCPYGYTGIVERYMKKVLQSSVTFGCGQANEPSEQVAGCQQ